jgi:SAM-dependent methyltransferase
MLHEPRIDFYRRVIDEWIPDRTASVLVVGGGENDRDVFQSLGFRDVTITNVATALDRADCAGFRTIVVDAERMDLPNESYDYAVVHAVLHHCASPHAGLLELYRVSRRAAIFIEARDSLTVRLLGRLGLSQVYEYGAVISNNCEAGGMRDTQIPNYVYRWTEREVEKTISSYAPHARHSFDYRQGNTVDCQRGGTVKAMLVRLLVPLYWVFVWVCPGQQNLFAVRVTKPSIPRDLHPWLLQQEGKVVFNRGWSPDGVPAREAKTGE